MNHYVMSAPADTVEAMGKLETVCNERAMGTLAGSSVRIVN